MADIKTARPTEFKGVVYRSKSEAMFAASISYLGYKWIYEPRFFEIDGWRPDFAIPVHNGNEFGFEVIEFKPYRATETYMEELADRFRRLRSCVKIPFSAYLVTFNWFDQGQSCDMVWDFDDTDCSRSSRGHLFECGYMTQSSMMHALEYRFDLEVRT